MTQWKIFQTKKVKSQSNKDLQVRSDDSSQLEGLEQPKNLQLLLLETKALTLMGRLGLLHLK